MKQTANIKSYSTLEVVNKNLKGETVAEAERLVRGYASTIDKDRDGDIITLEALQKGIKSGIPMFYNHRSYDYPIGYVNDYALNDKGLIIEGKLINSKEADQVHSLVKQKAIRSFSIGFISKQSEPIYKNNNGEKVITGFEFKDIDIYEISIVSIPANPNANIDEVKNIYGYEHMYNTLETKLITRFNQLLKGVINNG